MLVLTWNLFHGRALPGTGRDLCEDFASALAGWRWDVALLQEVPPWWPPALAAAAGAQQRSVLTSRNAALPLRRGLARRWPDAMKSSGGGANAILVRGSVIAEHRRARLRSWPERRLVHAVRLAGGTWLANVHCQGGGGGMRARRDLARAAAAAERWAAGLPLVLGGDFNLGRPEVAGMAWAGGRAVDHVLARGLEPAGPAQTLERGALSDHAPVLVELREGASAGRRPELT